MMLFHVSPSVLKTRKGVEFNKNSRKIRENVDHVNAKTNKTSKQAHWNDDVLMHIQTIQTISLSFLPELAEFGAL